MGFSYFLLADDPSGALYNPSAIGYIQGWQSQMMYEKAADYGYAVSENPYYGLLGVSYHRPNLGTFAFNSLQSGSFTEPTSIATANHAVLSFGRQLGNSWAAGASIKYFSETGYGERSAFDLDWGLTYRSPYGISIATAIENLARSELTPEYLGVREYLPRRGRLGAAYFIGGDNFQGSLLAAGQLEESGISQKYSTILTNIGSEWWLFTQRTFSLGARAGYTFGQGVQNDIKADYTGPSAGLSLNFRIGFNDLRLDYSWQAFPYETADGSTPGNHFVAATFGWGGVPNYPTRQTADYAQRPQPSENLPQIQLQTEIAPTEGAKETVLPFEAEMEVSDISSMDMKRIIFYVRPQQVVRTSGWKLFVFKARIKNWNEADAERWNIATVEGKGVPPINIIWNGLNKDGELTPNGKYFFVLQARDARGNTYLTNWYGFKIE